jgi:hypothetical protein
MQRTVVFDRSDGGEVLKHDTGWQAVGDGAFELLDDNTKLKGPVDHLTRVRNIIFEGAPVQAPGTGDPHMKIYARVTFDADVVYDGALKIVANGKDLAASTPGHGIVGYAIETVGPAPQPPDVIALMEAIGAKTGSTRLTGATACIANVGSPGKNRFTLNVSSFGAALADGGQPKLQLAVFGTPRLPKDGQWSIAKRAGTADQPQAVDSKTPIPLTRGTGSAQPPPGGGGSYGQNWRLLDPEDAQSVDSPSTFYGLLQGTGTSKTLLEHPLIRDDGQALGFDNQPKLADVGALLGVGGLFPELGKALEIPSTDDLPLQADGFKRTYDWDINDPDRTLLDLAIVHLVLVYGTADPNDPNTVVPAHGTLVLDATPGAPKSIVVSMSLAVSAGTVTLGLMLTGNAEVDVLGGLASASLTLSAGILVTIHEITDTADLGGEVAVGATMPYAAPHAIP